LCVCSFLPIFLFIISFHNDNKVASRFYLHTYSYCFIQLNDRIIYLAYYVLVSRNVLHRCCIVWHRIALYCTSLSFSLSFSPSFGLSVSLSVSFSLSLSLSLSLCIVLYCIVLYCIVLDWIGLDWIGLDWIGLSGIRSSRSYMICVITCSESLYAGMMNIGRTHTHSLSLSRFSLSLSVCPSVSLCLCL
jgi:hypothetical protein